MNRFEPKEIKNSSKYLQEKLNLVTNKKEIIEDKVFKIEKKEESSLKRFVNSFFN